VQAIRTTKGQDRPPRHFPAVSAVAAPMAADSPVNAPRGGRRVPAEGHRPRAVVGLRAHGSHRPARAMHEAGSRRACPGGACPGRSLPAENVAARSDPGGRVHVRFDATIPVSSATGAAARFGAVPERTRPCRRAALCGLGRRHGACRCGAEVVRPRILPGAVPRSRPKLPARIGLAGVFFTRSAGLGDGIRRPRQDRRRCFDARPSGIGRPGFGDRPRRMRSPHPGPARGVRRAVPIPVGRPA
jgi:hypothetical protein